MDTNGGLDFAQSRLRALDWVVASIQDVYKRQELLHTQLYGCYLACDARLHQNLPPERAKTFLFDGCPAPRCV